MSFLLLREFFLVYIFLFYTYFFFMLDEEFVIFIVISIWILLLIIFYLKVISSIFVDSLELLTNEYFFFHNKKNMFLAVFKDQYFDFVLFNAYLSKFLAVFYYKLHNFINVKILNFYVLSNLFLSEIINFLKITYKASLILCYLTVFSYLHKTLFLFETEKTKFFNFFFNPFDALKQKIESSLLDSQYKTKKQLNAQHKHLVIFFRGSYVRNFDISEKFLYDQVIGAFIELFGKKNISSVLKNLYFLNQFFKCEHLLSNLKSIKKKG